MSYLLKLALRYLSERRARTMLTTLSIVVGVMLIFGLNGMVPALEDSLRQSTMTTANQVDLTVTSESRGVFDQALVEEVGRIPGVAAAAGSLIRAVALPPDLAPEIEDGPPLSVLNITGLDVETAAAARALILVAGRDLATVDTETILVPEALAHRTGLAVGDAFRLPAAFGTAELKIVGLVADPASPAGDAAYVSLPVAQDLLNLPGQINTVEILFAAGVDSQATAQAVLDRLGPGFKTGPLDTGTQFTASLEIAGAVFTFFGVLVLAMAGFIIFNTFRTVV
ncbi:MAG: ABC transporter permease, partial [Chloroflexota bacterium]